MTIVISDTSPIRALYHLGLLEILEQLYDEVNVPLAVADELSQAPSGQSSIALDQLAEFDFLKVRPVSHSAELGRFLVHLDPGEAEVFALAIELQADLLLIDEMAGRSVAKREGFEVIGVLGVLLEAKHQGMIESILPLIDQLLNHHQFFIGEQLRRQVLRSAGE